MNKNIFCVPKRVIVNLVKIPRIYYISMLNLYFSVILIILIGINGFQNCKSYKKYVIYRIRLPIYLHNVKNNLNIMHLKYQILFFNSLFYVYTFHVGRYI